MEVPSGTSRWVSKNHFIVEQRGCATRQPFNQMPAELANPCEFGQHKFHDDNPPADPLEHFYDFRLVRTPEIPPRASFRSYCRQLADCLPGILLSGPSQPDRLVPVYRCPAEDNPGGDHALRLFDFFGAVSEGVPPLELSRWLRSDRLRGIRDFQKVVSG